MDAANDEAQIHPHSYCKRCYEAMQRILKAASQSTSPFQQPHGAVQVGSSCIRWWVQGEGQCSSNVNLYIIYIQIIGL